MEFKIAQLEKDLAAASAALRTPERAQLDELTAMLAESSEMVEQCVFFSLSFVLNARLILRERSYKDHSASLKASNVSLTREIKLKTDDLARKEKNCVALEKQLAGAKADRAESENQVAELKAWLVEVEKAKLEELKKGKMGVGLNGGGLETGRKEKLEARLRESGVQERQSDMSFGSAGESPLRSVSSS